MIVRDSAWTPITLESAGTTMVRTCESALAMRTEACQGILTGAQTTDIARGMTIDLAIALPSTVDVAIEIDRTMALVANAVTAVVAAAARTCSHRLLVVTVVVVVDDTGLTGEATRFSVTDPSLDMETGLLVLFEAATAAVELIARPWAVVVA